MKKMYCYNLLYYTPKLWERAVLMFCRLETHEALGSVVWYKKFANRMYIYGYIRVNVSSDAAYTTDANSIDGYESASNN